MCASQDSVILSNKHQSHKLFWVGGSRSSGLLLVCGDVVVAPGENRTIIEEEVLKLVIRPKRLLLGAGL